MASHIREAVVPSCGLLATKQRKKKLALIQIAKHAFRDDFRRDLLRAAAGDGQRAIHIQCADQLVLTDVDEGRETVETVSTSDELWQTLAPRIRGHVPIVLTGLAANWSSVAVRITRRFPRRSRVYDVQDELSYGATGSAYLKFLVRDRIWRSLSSRTIVLEEGMKRFYPRAYHLENASHLKPVSVSENGRAVYIGSIDARVDFDLLEELGRTLPIDIFGRVHGWTPWLTRSLDQLQERQPNIRFIGAYRNEDLASFINNYQIGLLPYHVGHRMTEHINPDKIYHYLNAGLGVISTPIPQARRMVDYIGLMTNGADYAAAATDALDRRRSWQASANTWPLRWGELATAMAN